MLSTKKHSIDGILLLDKAINITSNTALQDTKKLYHAKKAGHTGSLDPLASGMLPICFGQATKFSQFLLEADKSYHVTAKLGISTSTGDSEGSIIEEHPVTNINVQQITATLKKYTGEIEQIPSMYSAIKHNGQPLYKLARQGIEIERQPRKITIYQLNFLSYADGNLILSVECSKGTYVRTLVEDIGRDLGCGAHVTALRRLKVGQYLEEQMYSFIQLKKISEDSGQNALDHLLLPIESIAINLPKVNL
jgi:tRNA pseudouridine55 synthase